jgi:hypothetical protein
MGPLEARAERRMQETVRKEGAREGSEEGARREGPVLWPVAIAVRRGMLTPPTYEIQ